VLEPLTGLMLAKLYPDVTAHFSRFQVTEISLEERALSQFDLEPILSAARLLADAMPTSIAWNGTSASWLGFERDEQLCRKIERQTGIPAITSVLALNEIMRARRITRIGLLTPYASDVQKKILQNYQSIGIECVAEAHFGEKTNFAFAEFDEPYLEQQIRHIADNKPQAIIVLCTNLRAARLVKRLELETGVPIYDSIAAVVWKALRQAEVDTSALAEWGSLFSLELEEVTHEHL
jgi:maleate isomerase